MLLTPSISLSTRIRSQSQGENSHIFWASSDVPHLGDKVNEIIILVYVDDLTLACNNLAALTVHSWGLKSIEIVQNTRFISLNRNIPLICLKRRRTTCQEFPTWVQLEVWCISWGHWSWSRHCLSCLGLVKSMRMWFNMFSSISKSTVDFGIGVWAIGFYSSSAITRNHLRQVYTQLLEITV